MSHQHKLHTLAHHGGTLLPGKACLPMVRTVQRGHFSETLHDYAVTSGGRGWNHSSSIKGYTAQLEVSRGMLGCRKLHC
ncbi:MAG: hypothetical protein JO316_08155 [Abitibacteriaceae bacterium]|nr:hypothetical protein [Abditibacteriaceae bacterium]